MERLRIVGTSHIAKDSLREVEREIDSFKPDIVAVELDRRRYASLLGKQQKAYLNLSAVRQIGFLGFSFALIASLVQRKLGDIVGMDPGAEMESAIRLAKKRKLQVALIDQDIMITLNRLRMTGQEKRNLARDIFNGLVLRKPELGVSFDLSKVPSDEVIRVLLGKLRERYPSLYRVLVHERNVVMSKNLSRILAEHPDKKVLAVVGAGHEDGMRQLLYGSNSFSFGHTITA